ncbi:hypothetical protein SVAN01_04079 [Stagonosporopsis vannaccii]|nr:hypothetical protein SVAN01_04079 [Stagonosporopsis vannaccii]
MHAISCATELPEPAEVRKRTAAIGPRASISAESSALTPPTSPSRRSPENKQRTKRNQREIYNEHLRTWASNHDSSAHFHGSICLNPPGVHPSEDTELGKSVSCILIGAYTGSPPKKIVIRLFQSQRYEGQQDMQEKMENTYCQSAMPYQLVIRSGSGWVPARQYFDRHYFVHQTRARFRSATQHSAQSNFAQSHSMVSNSTASLANIQSAGLAGLMSNNGITNLTPSNSQATLTSNDSVLLVRNPAVNTTSSPNRSTRTCSVPAHLSSSRHASSATGSIKISPLFRPFLRLPQELQDEILYQAVGYTRVISLTQGTHSLPASTPPPITVSKLFQISRAINEHMVSHIFRSTNFHFGITGFTKFLWQVGPLNRSGIRHLTFHFSKASLLHCIRWMAADPVWELFEPPVATNPPTLMYFWRCQLQDLMKELNLATLTIDIKDVPLADVPMLVRIISTAMGSVKGIHIIDSYIRSDKSIGEFTQELHLRFPHMRHFTWRDMSLQYHNDYKYQRWHMKHVLGLRDVDLRPILDTWMNKDKDFFDS